MIFINNKIVKVIEVVFTNTETRRVSSDMIVTRLVSLSVDEVAAVVILFGVESFSCFEFLDLL